VSIDVTQYSEGIMTVSIIEEPKYGTATVDGTTITYHNTAETEEDTIVYIARRHFAP
jgi:hypothetical protein